MLGLTLGFRITQNGLGSLVREQQIATLTMVEMQKVATEHNIHGEAATIDFHNSSPSKCYAQQAPDSCVRLSCLLWQKLIRMLEMFHKLGKEPPAPCTACAACNRGVKGDAAHLPHSIL